MSWETYYRERIVSQEEAIRHIEPNEKVFLAGLSNEPQTLVEELVNQKERFGHVTLYTMVQGSPCIYATEENAPYFDIKYFLSSGNLKYANKIGKAEYIPINISDIPKWLNEYEIDTVLLQVTEPNDQGYCSLGVSVDFMHTAIKCGKKIIAQVNSKLPWTYGETLVPVNEIDYFVKSDKTPITLEQRPLTEMEKKIGANVAELIPDRATFQIGIGNIAESVLQHLEVKKDLGVHTGTFTDGLVDLIERGVVTNTHKTIDKGKVISTSSYGSEKLYKYIDNNPLFELHPVTYTHDARTIAKIDNFYAINSALQVDLSGQVNADCIGYLQLAGVGGQMDFIIGARLSRNGKTIIALPSTARSGSVSRIVVNAECVTSLRTEIDYVVTEFGVATLFGKSISERAEELIAIAHPDFREQLRYELKKSNYYN